MQLESGTTIDRYVVGDLLGRGGAAMVWRVRHGLLEVERALKVMLRRDARAHARSLIEGRVQAALQHPALLPVLDVIDVDGHAGLILPLVTGPSLHRLLSIYGPTRDEALALLIEVVHGLEHAHGRGLVHRDLKPGNILLELEGDRVQPRISDFGLVKVSASQDEALTQMGAAVGTPGYAAPEQLSDATSADHRADLFAVGVLLVELLTGNRPFPGSSIASVARAWEHGPDLRGLDVPEASLASRLLALDPAQRPGSVREVREALELLAWVDRSRALGRGGRLFAAAWGMRLHADPAPQKRTFSAPPTLAPPSLDEAPLPAPAPAGPATAYETTPSSVGVLSPARDGFVGREDDLSAVVHAFDDGARLVTLVGMGGTGKTRLALELGRRENHRFVAGVYFADLADAREPEDVERAVAKTLDVPLTPGMSDAVLNALIGRGQLLVILDNFEQLAETAAALVGHWVDTAPELRLLVTSRMPLRVRGERVLPLAPLDPAAGAALFRQRAEAAGGRADDDDAVAEVVRLLDGMPLGIELAAARARLLSPRQLVERLRGRLDTLRSRSVELPARHRTLRATIRWSWDLLAPWEQAALAQLSVFDGGFTLDAAVAVLELDAWPDSPWPEDALSELVDKSLVRLVHGPRSGTPRFILLRSVQQFAADQLAAADGRAQAELRHQQHYARFGQPQALEGLHQHGSTALHVRLHESLDNLVDAGTRAVQAGHLDLAVPLALVAARVLFVSGPLQVGRRLLEAVASQPIGEHPQHAELLSQLGEFRSLSGDPDGAHEALSAAVTTAAQRGDEVARARAIALLANHWLRTGDKDQAEARLQEALALGDAVGDDRTRSMARSNLGVLRYWQGRYDESELDYRAAIDLHRRMGNQRFEAVVLLNLGNLYGDRGRIDESRHHLEQALKLHREVGNRLAEGVTLGALGSLDLQQGHLGSARRLLRQSRRIHRHSGNRRSEAVVVGRLGALAHAEGDLAGALRIGFEALALHRDTGNRPFEGFQHLVVAEVLLDRGERADALRHLQEAEALLEGSGMVQVHVARLEQARVEALVAHHSGTGATPAHLARVEERAAALTADPSRLVRLSGALAVAEIAGLVGALAQKERALHDVAALAAPLNLSPSALLSQRVAALSARLSPPSTG